jgi:hypothetical protein
MQYAHGIAEREPFRGWCYVINATPTWLHKLSEDEYDAAVAAIQSTGADVCTFKIGKANSVEARVSSMQSGNACSLDELLRIPGGTYSEILLQQVAARTGYRRVSLDMWDGDYAADWFFGCGEGFLEYHEIDDISFLSIDGYAELMADTHGWSAA